MTDETKKTVSTAPNNHPEDGGPERIAWEKQTTVSAHEIAEAVADALYKLTPLIPQAKRAIVIATIEEVLDRML